MDWYIFLTPLLLLPIIFLFRLIGCGLDEHGGYSGPGYSGPPYTTNGKTFILTTNGIPETSVNPINSLTPVFLIGLDYQFIGPTYNVIHPNGVPGRTIGPANDVTIPSNLTIECACYVYFTRVGKPVPSWSPAGDKLAGPVAVEKSAEQLIFDLNYHGPDQPRPGN
jgi:hypothetical protein